MNSPSSDGTDLDELCETVRELLAARRFDECESLISAAMRQYPHAPHPHNLYGLVFEAKGNRRSAMNHYRAAWALDATYIPAQHNMNRLGTFHPRGDRAYSEADCPDGADKGSFVIERDENGIGRVVRSMSCEIKYDVNGVGHVVRRTEEVM